MIREADTLALGTLSPPYPRAAGPALAPTAEPVPLNAPAEVETVEQEITRLTWAVLDGSASLHDRQRLAELVNAQHARRHRIDR
jgi:hypothetical protein